METNTQSLSDLNEFRKQYPEHDSGDLQTFVMGWQKGNNQLKAENEKLKEDNRVLLENLTRIIDRVEENGFHTVFTSAYERAKAAIKQVNQ